jgi:dTDP-4-amino-4,6-dideoxygalactose transaminase
MTIKLFDHLVHGLASANVEDVLRSGWTGLGKKVEEFENAFGKYIGGDKHVVAFNSGTSALRAALACEDSFNSGDYIISTPNTFVSTNHVIKQWGMEVAFADIDPRTGNIDLESIDRLIRRLRRAGNKVSGVMVVHYGGLMVDLDELYELSKASRVKVIEDCAHACGSYQHKVHAGACYMTQLAAFSFHSVKNLAVGDGGALVLADKDQADFCRKYRWLGINKSTADRSKEGKYAWRYDVDMFGEKSHMNNITAALGLGQLEHLTKDNGKRRKLYNRYLDNLGCLVEFPFLDFHNEVQEWNIPSFHLCSILLKDQEERDKVMEHLNSNDIQTGVHYYPNNWYDLYKDCVTDNGCENAVSFYERELSLPMHLRLKENDVDFICDKIKEVVC